MFDNQIHGFAHDDIAQDVDAFDPCVMAFSDLLTYSIAQNPNYFVGNHHRIIAEELMKVERGETKRLIITMPPRHGKSQLASEYFTAWYIGRNPEKQVIFATYSNDKAVDVGRSVRNQMVDPIFNEIFHSCNISEDAKSASNFTTSKGGKFVAIGIGGGATGRGANLFIIDDPIKSREEAESPTRRDRIIDWFGAVAYTRLMTDDNAIIMIMTRWHFDDLVGYALQELQHEGWKVLDLPAIAERDEIHHFENGETWERKEGEPLWPEYYSLDRLLTIKKTLKSRDWSSLYQQTPQPDEGGMIQLDWFNGPDNNRRFDMKSLPRFENIYFSCDTAFKEKDSNDPSALLVFGEYNNLFYLIHVTNERLAYPKLKKECIDLFKKYRSYAVNGCKAFIIEDKASGQSLIQDLKVDKEFVMPLIAINPENNKILRMDECIDIVTGKQIGRAHV